MGFNPMDWQEVTAGEDVDHCDKLGCSKPIAAGDVVRQGVSADKVVWYHRKGTCDGLTKAEAKAAGIGTGSATVKAAPPVATRGGVVADLPVAAKSLIGTADQTDDVAALAALSAAGLKLSDVVALLTQATQPTQRQATQQLRAASVIEPVAPPVAKRSRK